MESHLAPSLTVIARINSLVFSLGSSYRTTVCLSRRLGTGTWATDVRKQH